MSAKDLIKIVDIDLMFGKMKIEIKPLGVFGIK